MMNRASALLAREHISKIYFRRRKLTTSLHLYNSRLFSELHEYLLLLLGLTGENQARFSIYAFLDGLYLRLS